MSSGISYFEWLSYMWMSLIPYSIVALIGIILSIMHMGRKGNYAVFSLIAYIAGLIISWVVNYFAYSARVSSTRTAISIIAGLLGILSSVFLLLAIFLGRSKQTDQAPRYAPYLYNNPQQPYQTAGQVQNYPPQPPQNPPNSTP